MTWLAVTERLNRPISSTPASVDSTPRQLDDPSVIAIKEPGCVETRLFFLAIGQAS